MLVIANGAVPLSTGTLVPDAGRRSIWLPVEVSVPGILIEDIVLPTPTPIAFAEVVVKLYSYPPLTLY
jgi:hypothetical protein